jgi:pyridoxal phosphate phosphatase PHOSPHO2
VVVFDFDKSLVDDNTDDWVPRVLAPDLLPFIREQYRAGRQWTELMHEVAGKLHEAGHRREHLLAALCTIPVHSDMLAAVREAAGCGVPVHIVSDANTVYISCLLEHLGIADLIASTVTNPAHFDKETGRLCILKHTDGASPHGCGRCPVNMCKAAILRNHLRVLEHDYRVLYVGDGGGDVCPCLALSADSVACARTGHPMLKELQVAKAAGLLAAKLVPWTDGSDVLRAVREFVADGSGAGAATGAGSVPSSGEPAMVSVLPVCGAAAGADRGLQSGKPGAGDGEPSGHCIGTDAP